MQSYGGKNSVFLKIFRHPFGRVLWRRAAVEVGGSLCARACCGLFWTNGFPSSRCYWDFSHSFHAPSFGKIIGTCSGYQGVKFLGGLLAWCITIWAEWIPLDCHSSTSNWFSLVTGLGLPRQFLGPVTIYTVGSPWKTMQAYLGCLQLAQSGLTVLSDQVLCVSFICLCLQIDHIVSSRLEPYWKTMITCLPGNL